MIKAVARGGDGKPLLILGLSRKNTELLLDGRPISIELMGLIGKEATVLLMAGETEEAMHEQLKEFIGPETRIERSEPKEVG